MDKKDQAEEFIENSRHAIQHLFDALSEYNRVLERAQTTVEEIERSKTCCLTYLCIVINGLPMPIIITRSM